MTISLRINSVLGDVLKFALPFANFIMSNVLLSTAFKAAFLTPSNLRQNP